MNRKELRATTFLASDYAAALISLVSNLEGYNIPNDEPFSEEMICWLDKLARDLHICAGSLCKQIRNNEHEPPKESHD